MSEAFRRRFEQLGLPKQLLTMLVALVQENDGEVSIPVSVLDNIDTGHSLTFSYEKDAVVLRSNEKGAKLYVVDAAAQPWENPNSPIPLSIPPGQRVQRTSLKSDADLAELERQIHTDQANSRRMPPASPWRTS